MTHQQKLYFPIHLTAQNFLPLKFVDPEIFSHPQFFLTHKLFLSPQICFTSQTNVYHPKNVLAPCPPPSIYEKMLTDFENEDTKSLKHVNKPVKNNKTIVDSKPPNLTKSKKENK